MKYRTVSRSQLTTVLVAFMLVFSMVAVATPAMAGEEGGTDEVHTLENGEDLYLVFGADLGDQSLEEYIETHADPDEDNGVDVVEYEDVDDVELVQEGQATSVSVDGGEATAIQDATQRNANSQTGEASAENYEIESYTAEFEDVGDLTVIFGNGGQSFDGWGIAGEDGDDLSVSQVADASVTQSQDVAQANVNEQSTALAYAEDGSEAIAFQQSEQSNLNLQEGSANATNVLAADLDGDEDREEMREKHKKKKQDGDSDVDVAQDADATVEQNQSVDQANVNEQTGAVAIAVGEDSVATAIQMTDQSNLNEQVATADALNAMLETAGMNVATAGSDAGTDLLTQDGEKMLDPKEKKDDDEHDADVTQTAEASVVQNQSVEQVNFNNQTTAAAIAVDESESIAVQLSFQENINAQVASADVLNVLGVETDDLDDYEDEDFDGVVLRNTTSVNLEGDGVEGDSHLSFDYDGDSDQRNDVEQWSTAEIEQSQEVLQANLNEQQGAIAVAEDEGSAETVQLTIQENENIQFASAESTNVAEGVVDEGEDEDHEKDDGDDHEKDDDGDDHEKDGDTGDNDHEKDDGDDTGSDDGDDTGSEDGDDTGSDSDDGDTVGPSDDDDGDDEENQDTIPGFGVLVAIVALAIVGATRVVSNR